MKVSELSRGEKIQLIKDLAAGEVSVVNGEIINQKGVVLIVKDGQYYLDGTLVDKAEIEKHVEAMIILPAKNEEIEE